MKFITILFFPIIALSNPITVIVDSGVDLNHTFFEGVHLNTVNLSSKPLSSSMDHGTAVLGVFLEESKAKDVMFIKNIDHTIEVSEADFNRKDPYSEAIELSIQNKAKIISFSQISNRKTDTMVESFKKAEKAGILIITASGNTGFDLNRFEEIGLADRNYFPCSLNLSNIICVGSVSKDLEVVSNYGSRFVDVFAVGEEVLAPKPNNQVGYMSGSSFATPKISAKAFLIWEKNPKMTYKEVRKELINSLRFAKSLKSKSKTGRYLFEH